MSFESLRTSPSTRKWLLEVRRQGRWSERNPSQIFKFIKMHKAIVVEECSQAVRQKSFEVQLRPSIELESKDYSKQSRIKLVLGSKAERDHSLCRVLVTRPTLHWSHIMHYHTLYLRQTHIKTFLPCTVFCKLTSQEWSKMCPQDKPFLEMYELNNPAFSINLGHDLLEKIRTHIIK